MIRFRLTFPDAPTLGGDDFDTVDDANEAARPFKRAGVKVLVETVDVDPNDLPDAVERVLDQPKCRQIRWAGVAP